MIYPKKIIDKDVWTLALERIEYTYSIADHVKVSFSGGKDSTALLHAALVVATKLKRLPVECIFWDEEAMPDETIEYVRRVSQWPEVRLRWLCLPVKHRCAADRANPYWYPWAPEQKDIWCRPLPPEAITEWEGFTRVSIPELNWTCAEKKGTTAILVGLAARESMRRYTAVATRVYNNYISRSSQNGRHFFMVKPIYDWSNEDVWTAPRKLGWDYNRS